MAGKKRLVVCDGPWLVVQLRQHCITSFTQNWQTYKDGFGSLQTDLWLGLEAMHQITKRPHKARIHLIAENGTAYMAEYASFKVGDENSNYTLSVSGHSGNASDDISNGKGKINDKTITNGRPFTTLDRDNDLREPMNCAGNYYSAWWHNSCSAVHLNTPCKNQAGYLCRGKKVKCLLWYSISISDSGRMPLNYTRIDIMPNP